MMKTKEKEKIPVDQAPLREGETGESLRRARARRSYRAYLIAGGILFAVASLLQTLAAWLVSTFNIKFSDLLYTLLSPLDGSNTDIVYSFLRSCRRSLLITAAFLLVCILIGWMRRHAQETFTLRLFGRRVTRCVMDIPCWFVFFFSIFFLLRSAAYTDRVLGIREYIRFRSSSTQLYEQYYVDAGDIVITPPEKPKNLLHIYLESMETTYASQQAGGRQEEGYIPGLTALAQENVSFSNSTQLGGFHSCNGTGWTMGALFATTTGLPFAFPVGGNAMDLRAHIAPGCTSLGDLLQEQGYQNFFLCGSDGNFAGRKKYFEQHGDYTVYDLLTAREEGYIPQDYFVWWGYEDAVLYEIAKDKLTGLAHSSQPFNFTMLTVDTHHVGGYVCGLCREDYASQTANVVACADRQLMDFIGWCRQQDFYSDTLIVITGDHPRMDTNLVEGVPYYDRTIYNCFIGADVPEGARLQEREFTAMDIFPTVLRALGFELEGSRLGIGTDLFSSQPTLAESMGYAQLDQELRKYSDYYVKRFS